MPASKVIKRIIKREGRSTNTVGAFLTDFSDDRQMKILNGAMKKASKDQQKILDRYDKKYSSV